MSTLPDTRHRVFCNETTLHCPNVAAGPAELREAVFAWLHQHGLSEHDVAANAPIVRDPDARSLTWTGVVRGEGMRQQVTISPSTESPETRSPWPAPFPQILLDQPDPETCPTCHRALGAVTWPESWEAEQPKDHREADRG